MRFYGKPRSRQVWLILLIALFLIVPAFGLGQSRTDASSLISNHISQSIKNSQTPVSPSLAQIPSSPIKSSAISSIAAPTTTAPLTYHGGPIQHSQNVYAIFWLPAGARFEPTGNDSRFEALISLYFNDVGGSNLSKLMVQYPDNINASPTTTVSFGGGFVDTTPYPHAGTTSVPLLGQDITNEIQKIISSGTLPTGINDVYYIFTANGINSCEDQAMTLCTFPTTQSSGFCAYHSYFLASADEPFVDIAVNPSGIAGGCQISASAYPNNDSIADSEINLASQEQFNVQTDPVLTSWFDTTSTTEISNKCAGLYGAVNVTDGHNIVLKGHKYIVQQEWSNKIGGCSLTFPATASVQVTLTPSGYSNILSSTNYFPLSYAIGNQLFVVEYSGGMVTINADSNTSLSIGPMSSQSNANLEKWCLDFSCQGDVVNLGNGVSPVSLVYYDVLLQTVYEATSDSSLPTTFASIAYTTSPKTVSSVSLPSVASYTLTGSSEGIWVERGTFASISSQTFVKTSGVERWFTPASNWTISQPLQIPLTISYHQFSMNYYFSAVGGGSGYTGPSVTYVSNGVQRSTVANSTVWCDANSVYSYGGVLGSSITSERWVSLTGTGSGRVTTSATIQNNYYNQYDVSVAYSILGAPGSEEAPPMFAGYSFGSAITVPVTQTIASYWLDAGSNYTVTKLLTGSNSTDRWISIQSNFGIINASTSKLFSYYHQFALNFSYAIVGGGLPPNLPAVNYTSLNNNASMRLSNSPSPVWINAGSIFNVSSAMAAHNSTERWAFSSESDTANAPGLVHIILYHQYQVSFTITIAGGGSPSTAPKVSAFAFGKPESLQTVNMTTVWLDAGSTYSLPKSLGTVATERWLTLSTPTGVVNSSQIISLSYHHQFLISLAYNVINGPDSTGGPVATVVNFGTTDSVTVNQTAGQVWVDAGTPVALPSLLPGSTSVERWFTNSSITGTSSPALALNPTYDHQFMVSLSTNPQGIPVVLSQQTGWYDSGATLGVQPLPGRGWNFESWTGQGNGAYSGPLSTLLLTVTTPVTETANFYAALTIAAPGTGSVTYSFGNVTGSVGQGQSKIVFVPPGQILSVSANPFPVFYAFSEWNGTIGGGPNATTISQNPLTFSISSPSSLDVSFRINLLGVIIVVVVVVVAVASVFLFRRRNRPREAGDEYVSEEEEVYSANSTIDTMEGS